MESDLTYGPENPIYRRLLLARSTVCDILSRHGMVPKKRNRRHIGHPERHAWRAFPADLPPSSGMVGGLGKSVSFARRATLHVFAQRIRQLDLAAHSARKTRGQKYVRSAEALTENKGSR